MIQLHLQNLYLVDKLNELILQVCTKVCISYEISYWLLMYVQTGLLVILIFDTIHALTLTGRESCELMELE